MVFRKKRGAPEIPRSFKGNDRVFAAILYAALKRAGYDDVYFLPSKPQSGMCIGRRGSTFVVGKIADIFYFTPTDAQQCAKKLNAEFRKATGVPGNLARTQAGRTRVGGVNYAEIVMQCPDSATLALLRSNFLK